MTPQQWKDCLLVWGGCAYCPRTTRLHIDHVVPLVRGGKHDISNIVPACESCNTSKGARLLSDWRRPARCYYPGQPAKAAMTAMQLTNTTSTSQPVAVVFDIRL